MPTASSAFSQLTSRVLSYQHPELLERLKRELALSEQDADELFEDLKRFLLLCGVHVNRELVPSERIDEAWHNFILYTRDYSNFCDEMFGEYIDHLPNSYLKPEQHKSAFQETLAVARAFFGELGGNWQMMGASRWEPPPPKSKRDTRPPGVELH